MPEAPRILFFDNQTTVVNMVPQLQSLGAEVEIAESVDQSLKLLRSSREENRPFNLVWTRMWVGKDQHAGLAIVEAALEVEEESQKPKVLVTTAHPVLYSAQQLRYPEIMIMDIRQLNLAKVREIMVEITPQP